ncbi:hypothetical protein F5I97DRAFT_778278 [Phlebopus sp. FC_14]|nr:hypothetical protein F5I97DRAFT_778278 [Phlebopus sp. FC_14]
MSRASIDQEANGEVPTDFDVTMSLTQWNVAFDYPTCGKVTKSCRDGLRRKFSVALGAGLMAVAAVFQTASQSVDMSIGARFVIGFGFTFGLCAAPLLISEVAYPSHCGQATSLYSSISCCLDSGYIVVCIENSRSLADFTTFLQVGAWSIPLALQVLPSVPQLVFIWFIPGSPRWLISKGKEDRALKILADSNVHDP